MPLVEWLLEPAVVLALALGLLAAGLVARRRWLARQGAVFELSVNQRRSTTGRGWVLGLGRYDDDQLQWYRAFSLSWRPRLNFTRGGLQIVRHRTPQGTESFSLYSGHVILECATATGPVQLALSEEASTALMAWLQSAPPGQLDNVV